MKLEKTLKIFPILLILISININSAPLSNEIRACNEAVNQQQTAQALMQAEAILKADSQNHEGLICKGRALSQQNKADEALKTFDQALISAKTPFENIITYILIGNLQRDRQQYQPAIDGYQKSLALSESDKNEKFQRVNHNLIGNVFTLDGKLDQAVANYLAGAKLANNDNERAESYQLLANTYSALGQYDLAIENQLKALLMQDKAGTLDEQALAQIALGDLYLKAKDYTNAEKTFGRLLKFSQDNGGEYYEAKSNLYLAKAHAAQGDSAGAQSLMEQARNVAKRVNDADLNREIEAAAASL